MKNTLSIDVFIGWQKEKHEPYAAVSIEGRTLKMIAYMDGRISVAHGETPLYVGSDGNAAISAFNAVIDPPMSLQPDIIGSAITEPDEQDRNEARINTDRL